MPIEMDTKPKYAVRCSKEEGPKLLDPSMIAKNPARTELCKGTDEFR